MIDYIKRNLLHPLSFFGVFFIILALLFGASTMYKCSHNAKIKHDRVKITGTIANASEVTIKKRYSKRGNGIQRYLQDLDISYDYHNKNYIKSYKLICAWCCFHRNTHSLFNHLLRNYLLIRRI